MSKIQCKCKDAGYPKQDLGTPKEVIFIEQKDMVFDNKGRWLRMKRAYGKFKRRITRIKL